MGLSVEERFFELTVTEGLGLGSRITGAGSITGPQNAVTRPRDLHNHTLHVNRQDMRSSKIRKVAEVEVAFPLSSPPPSSASASGTPSSILTTIRDIERGILDGQDLQHLNGLTLLLVHVRALLQSMIGALEEESGAEKVLNNKDREVAGLQSMHALRRIFTALVNRGDVRKPITKDSTTASSPVNAITPDTSLAKTSGALGKGEVLSGASRAQGRKRAGHVEIQEHQNETHAVNAEESLRIFRQWAYRQYATFLSLLLDLVEGKAHDIAHHSSSSSSSSSLTSIKPAFSIKVRIRAAALRTIMEMVKVESVVLHKNYRSFGHELFYRLLMGLLSSSTNSISSRHSHKYGNSDKEEESRKVVDARDLADLLEVLRVDYIEPYCDVRYWLLKGLGIWARKELKEGRCRTSTEQEEASRTETALKLLMMVRLSEEESAMRLLWVSLQDEKGDGALLPNQGGKEEEEEEEETGWDWSGDEGMGHEEDEEALGKDGARERVPNVASLSAHRKALEAAWLGCLRLPDLPPALYRSITQHVARHVLEHLPRPLLLADFFTAAYAQGGLTAVIALEGLFVLMQAHNLEYPSFYCSLYRLLSPGPQVLYSRHRARFFRLLRLCLISTLVPAHVVAAFLKRLGRLSLRAPAPSVIFFLSLLTVVLRAHPSCLALLHRSRALKGIDEAQAVDRFDPGVEDPAAAFQMTEFAAGKHEGEDQDGNNDAQMGGIQTSLWEVAALQMHYHHAVASLAKGLEITTPEDPKKPLSMNMEAMASYTYTELFTLEGKYWKRGKKEEMAGRKRRRKGLEGGQEEGVALAHERKPRSGKLFQAGDVFDGLFVLPSLSAVRKE